MVVDLEYHDESHVKILCENSIAQEIREHFSFKIPNAHFMPAVKMKIWDGYIRMLDPKTKLFPKGLINELKSYCEENEYELNDNGLLSTVPFSTHEANEFIDGLTLPFKPFDYQMDTLIKAVQNKRQLFVSPTNSGKSYGIFLIIKYLKKKTLIVVPRIGLVKQYIDDFRTYDSSGKTSEDIHPIHEGQEHDSDKSIYISTWQSIAKNKKSWFNQFDAVIGDEAHNFKAKSLENILLKCTRAQYKLGFTGTLDGLFINRMILEGIFGPVYTVTSNHELINRGISAAIDIKCIVLRHPEAARKLYKKAAYADEVEYIVQNEKRNNFLANLTHSLNGNVLILFRYVEKHGVPLHDIILKKNTKNRPVFFIHGEIDADVRNDARKEIDTKNNSIIVASLGTFSEGISIKNINYIIFCSPSKGRVKVLQSIGRGLRVTETKKTLSLYDIADDLSLGRSTNHTLKHYLHRIKIYIDEKFPFKQYKVELPE